MLVLLLCIPYIFIYLRHGKQLWVALRNFYAMLYTIMWNWNNKKLGRILFRFFLISPQTSLFEIKINLKLHFFFYYIIKYVEKKTMAHGFMLICFGTTLNYYFIIWWMLVILTKNYYTVLPEYKYSNLVINGWPLNNRTTEQQKNLIIFYSS